MELTGAGLSVRMSDLIEKVARAVIRAELGKDNFGNPATEERIAAEYLREKGWRDLVTRTAILATLEAIREPTTKQLDTVCSSDPYSPYTDDAMRSVYQDMIDAKIKEIKEE